jgi:hypothetical protein
LCLIAEKRVRDEGGGNFEFGAEEVLGLVGVLLTAVITADFQTLVKSRRRHDRIGLGERNFVAEEEILALVVTTVLAEYNPEIFRVVGHAVLQEWRPAGEGRESMTRL